MVIFNSYVKLPEGIFHGFTENFLCSQWEIWGNLFFGAFFGGVPEANPSFWWKRSAVTDAQVYIFIYVYIIEDRYICSLSFMNYLPGWWFGTWISFFHMLGINTPIWHTSYSPRPGGSVSSLPWSLWKAGFVVEIWSVWEVRNGYRWI